MYYTRRKNTIMVDCDDMFDVPAWAVILFGILAGLVIGFITGWCFHRDYVNYWAHRAAAARAGNIARMSPAMRGISVV